MLIFFFKRGKGFDIWRHTEARTYSFWLNFEFIFQKRKDYDERGLQMFTATLNIFPVTWQEKSCIHPSSCVSLFSSIFPLRVLSQQEKQTSPLGINYSKIRGLSRRALSFFSAAQVLSKRKVRPLVRSSVFPASLDFKEAAQTVSAISTNDRSGHWMIALIISNITNSFQRHSLIVLTPWHFIITQIGHSITLTSV